MNLQEQYKRLFKDKPRKGDNNLLSEGSSPKLQKAYDGVVAYYDTLGEPSPVDLHGFKKITQVIDANLKKESKYSPTLEKWIDKADKNSGYNRTLQNMKYAKMDTHPLDVIEYMQTALIDWFGNKLSSVVSEKDLFDFLGYLIQSYNGMLK